MPTHPRPRKSTCLGLEVPVSLGVGSGPCRQPSRSRGYGSHVEVDGDQIPAGTAACTKKPPVRCTVAMTMLLVVTPASDTFLDLTPDATVVTPLPF